MKQCPECSTENEDENTFCQSCGASLPEGGSKVIEPVGTVGVTPGVEEARASRPPPREAPKRGDASDPKISKSKSKTMLGIPAVTGPRRTPSQKILAPQKIKQRRDKTLMGMADEVKDIPLKEEEAEAAPAQEAIKPMVVKGISAAPAKEETSRALPDMDDDVEVSVDERAAAVKGEEIEEKAAVDASKELAEKVGELFSEESAPKEEAKTEPEEKPVPAHARKSAPPKKKELAPSIKTEAPAEEEKSKSAYWLLAVLAVIAAVIGYYYYTRSGGQEKQGPSSSETPAAEEAGPQAAGTGEQAQAPVESAPVKHKVLLEGVPENATVYVDDVIQLQNPVVLQQTDSPRVFKIEAPGFESWVKAVSVMSDATLRVDMKPAAALVEEAAASAEADSQKTVKDKSKKKKKKKNKIFSKDYNPYDDL